MLSVGPDAASGSCQAATTRGSHQQQQAEVIDITIRQSRTRTRRQQTVTVTHIPAASTLL